MVILEMVCPRLGRESAGSPWKSFSFAERFQLVGNLPVGSSAKLVQLTQGGWVSRGSVVGSADPRRLGQLGVGRWVS